MTIQEIIKEKGFRNFQHFATVALENQVAWESGEPNEVAEALYNPPDKQEKLASIPSDMSNELTGSLDLLKLPQNISPAKLSAPEGATKLLWGQYYRFLPIKVGVRVLSNMSSERLIDSCAFTENATGVALQLRRELEKLDRIDRRVFGELLSASFPVNNEKSIRRFVSHYLMYIRTSDMSLLGMMADLKFINVKFDENDTPKVGLTEYGYQFGCLRNPVLDLKEPDSLSQEEIDFLLNHIADNLPEEFEHMTTTLKTLAAGKQTREELNSVLKEYYTRYHEGSTWSDTVVNTMRSGLMSRLNDLGLIRREKRGKNIRYHVTSRGLKYVDGVRTEVKG
jgi:hypothetical protein